jgi:hypothetical protein
LKIILLIKITGMKKVLSILAVTAVIAVIMAGCKNKGSSETQSASIKYEDTVGLAQFQAWKVLHERESVLNYDPNPPVAQAPVQRARSTTRHRTSGYMTSSSSNYAKTTTRKKGWSNAAKYTAIGGGSGVVLGALLNRRNRVAGGVVGGLVLGGAGYLLGHAKDKREGRY